MFKLMNAEFFVWMKVQWMKKFEKYILYVRIGQFACKK